MVGLKYAYPEKFTYFDDPKTNHIDVFTKGSFNLTQHLFEDINIRFVDCLDFRSKLFLPHTNYVP